MAVEFDVAIVGATGAVGQELVKILAQRQFPIGTLYPLASERSVGKSVQFGEDEVPIGNLQDFDFAKVSLALFSAGGSVSRDYAPKAAAAGCVVVDNSSEFRYDDNIPLVVPEVNPEEIARYKSADNPSKNIIANPNCSTIQMVVALKPLHDEAGIERVDVATYQAVSGAGTPAIDALAKQAAALLSGAGGEVENDVFPAQIAFNAIPHIDVFQDNGYCREEMKMVWETQKIMGDASIQVNPTTVRIPVFYGHSEAVHLQLREPLGADRARELLSAAPGVCVIDERADGGYPTPAVHAAGNDEVFVGRIRDDLHSPTRLNLWIVSDNIRKGAALNAIQIAETLAARYL